MTEDIIKRLEKLRQWQEEQQKLLFDRQNTQRQQLGMEQQQMYELLGLSSSKTSSPNPSAGPGKKSASPDLASPPKQLEDKHRRNKAKNSDLEEGISFLDDDAEHSFNGNSVGASFKNDTGFKSNKNQQTTNISAKPFLRRGEGLKNRFKVDPDVFRLNNLPKYKFANSHKTLQYGKKISISCKEPTTKLPNNKCVSKPIVTDRLNVKSKLKLVDDKNNRGDSDEYNKEIKETNLLSSANNNELASGGDNTKTTIDSIGPVCWADVLETTNIEPVTITTQNYRHSAANIDESKNFDDTDNLSIFELLEQKAQENNFSLNASNIKKWIQEKADILAEQTALAAADRAAIDAMKKTKIIPFPCDVDKEVIPDESENSEDSDGYTTVSSDEDSEESDKQTSVDKRVRFAEEIKINDYVSDTESVASIEVFDNNLEPCDRSDFERFKANLFANDNLTTTEESTLIDQHLNASNECQNLMHAQRQDITEKSELLKTRLAELETEIMLFKENNNELTKLKQQHELDKIQLEEERIEMLEKLKDEKIKQEIYLHDERMKIEDDKKKLEKLIRDQRVPNRKERDEILKLREQVENLEKDGKLKEGKHVAAQSRMRAQLRNMEKEVKDLYFEIEHLKKDKKQLESENARLNRHNNNKMLIEINKTISKLAPKHLEPPVGVEVRNRNTKTVVAKVISHKKEPIPESRSRKNKDYRKQSLEMDQEEEDKNSDIHNGIGYYSSSEAEDVNFTDRRTVPHRKSIEKRNSLDEHLPENTRKKSANDFKREIQNDDGSKDIWYPNGNLKKISSNGMYIRMLYFNKDIKETNISEGTVKYYYAETNTWHTTYLDGLEILEFPNGQTEHRYKNGTVEVHFPNGSIRLSNATDQNKSEEWRYSDGTNVIQMKNGDKILSLPNGQKEIHTKLHKRREYPDGTVKILYPDGSQETRYSNGRVRLKDQDGNLVMDSENI